MADIATVIPAPAAASLMAWWNEMGVDTLIDENPVPWLDRARAKAPLVSEPAPPAEIRMPSTLPAFSRWLADSPDIPDAGPPGRRIAVSGNPQAPLMVMIDMPELGDADAGHLLSGDAGELFDRMLAALKLDRDSAYIAALCPGRVPTGLVPAASEPRLAEIGRRHIALAAPKQLWLMGSAVSRAILGMELAQARGTLHKINHENGTVEAVASFSPRFLLQSPRRKADAWADMQMLIKGNSA
jgi:DNA polymerase